MGSEKMAKLMSYNLDRVETMTNNINSQTLILKQINFDWTRYIADNKLPEGQMEKNVKWMVDMTTDWEDISNVLEKTLGQLRTIKQWKELKNNDRERATDAREYDNHD